MQVVEYHSIEVGGVCHTMAEQQWRSLGSAGKLHPDATPTVHKDMASATGFLPRQQCAAANSAAGTATRGGVRTQPAGEYVSCPPFEALNSTQQLGCTLREPTHCLCL